MTTTNTDQDQPGAELVCQLGALDPPARAEHFAWIRDELPSLIQRIDELPDGVELRLPVEALPRLAVFVDRERRCCKFLHFTIEVTPDRGLRLRLTGPPGVAGFMRAALDLLARR